MVRHKQRDLPLPIIQATDLNRTELHALATDRLIRYYNFIIDNDRSA